MKKLLIVTALIELGAGAALLCFPSWTVMLLLGSLLEASAVMTLGRVAGAALLSLGIACWLARNDARSEAARGLVGAMTFYNLGAAVLFAVAGIWSQPVGVALWPAFVLHAATAGWCVNTLLRKRTRTTSTTGPSET